MALVEETVTAATRVCRENFMVVVLDVGWMGKEIEAIN